MTVKNKNIPALRFNYNGEVWKKFHLNEIATKITDGTHDTPKQKSEGVPYLTAIHVKDGKIDFENCYYLDKKDHDIIYKRCNPEFGDLLVVNIGSGTATCASVLVNYEFSLKNVALIKPNKSIVFPDFLAQIQRKNAKKLFLQLTSGGAQPFLSLKEIGKLKVSLPSLPEQQKIASFLSSIDEKIQQLTRKKELLEQYKKGVMQQIFSGKLRFKPENGKAYPKWENHRLIDIADKKVKWSFTGGPFGSNLKSDEYTDSGVRILQLQNIGDGVFNDDYKIYTSEEKADELVSCNIYPGEILISKMGDPVARACRVPNKDERYLMASDGIRFVPDASRFSADFIFQSINHPIFRNMALSLSTGSTRKRIGLTELKEIVFTVPVLEEQQKIANYLSAIDTKIESVATQITQTQTFKKGLLQGMFV